MLVHVLYFAVVRERLRSATGGEDLVLPAGSGVSDLLDALEARHPVLAGLRPALRVAVNQAFVPLTSPLQDGDEVALIPPVAGGQPYCRLSSEPLSLDEVIRAVTPALGAQGGVVTFTGAVRGQSRGHQVVRLEYEAYEPMALRCLAALIADLEAQEPGVQVAIVHRTGVLQVGEVAVIIAASAPHRAEAFRACQQAIDRLKQDVPIWKKEVYRGQGGDEAAWIGDRP